LPHIDYVQVMLGGNSENLELRLSPRIEFDNDSRANISVDVSLELVLFKRRLDLEDFFESGIQDFQLGVDFRLGDWSHGLVSGGFSWMAILRV
jgi:hypothetical protein